MVQNCLSTFTDEGRVISTIDSGESGTGDGGGKVSARLHRHEVVGAMQHQCRYPHRLKRRCHIDLKRRCDGGADHPLTGRGSLEGGV